ncbi:N-glycosylase/DNA lyase [Eubacterium ruminantium]|nr:N-glycosylase/DNA lyase [Eubacterium ruminantium]
MKIYQDGNDTVLTEVMDFNLRESLECGQCFNFVRIDEGTDDSFCAYKVRAVGRILFVCQKFTDGSTGSLLRFKNTSLKEYNDVYAEYFDLNTDYGVIKNSIINSAPELQDIISRNSGIRLLNQEFFETVISFIISQNKQIPQIKAVVKNISEMAGEKVHYCGGKFDETGFTYDEGTDWLFPTAEEMRRLAEEDIRKCKAGFRAPYIMDAVKRLSFADETGLSESDLKGLNVDEARNSLMTIKGVGEKVANCILLYSLGFRSAFPVDVWMKRIMEHLYFHKDTDKKVIEQYAYDRFGSLAGYAQQYLFIYGRDNLNK